VPVPRLEDGTTREAYVQGVEEARSELARGELRKVVLSRRLVWRADRAFDPLALLARLSVESGLGAHVAVQHAGEAFVATTPERLVRRRGARVETEALAGTVDLRDTDPGALGASAKDLEEHAWVVRAIREALEPLCASLEAPAVPGLRALRQVAHLHTPIGALLREPAHVLELAARLHPTPAVGGYPTEPALRWIRAHEREPRGLYAGLVGYFDHEGDGDLWVGLRGAMVRGCELEQRVGAGLVEASCGEDEWLETEAKRRALARSLGAAP
jgi:menaquinone-specific isochorismate synthase